MAHFRSRSKNTERPVRSTGASSADAMIFVMASTHCPFCERHTHMTVHWAETRSIRQGQVASTLLQGIAICDNCGRASLGVTNTYPSAVSPSASFERATTLTWYPASGESPDFNDVPVEIAAAAKEAHAAASINAVMAAILMARTVVEASAKDKGITKGNLFQKIDDMAAASLIRESTREAAHEIRHMGNDMAHGDISDVPSSEDAVEVLALMDEVLNEVYQGPAITARIKAKRATL